MGNTIPWPPQSIERLTAMVGAGETSRAIGEALGTSIGAVDSQIIKLRRTGVDVPSRQKKYYDWTPARVNRLVEMWRKGKASDAIGAELEATPESVRTKVKGLRRKGYDLPSRIGSRPHRKPRKSRAKAPDRTKAETVNDLRPIAPLPHHPCQHIAGEVPRWPDEPVFCGKPRAVDSPYCPAHHKDMTTAFIPRDQRDAKAGKTVAPSYRMAGER